MGALAACELFSSGVRMTEPGVKPSDAQARAERRTEGGKVRVDPLAVAVRAAIVAVVVTVVVGTKAVHAPVVARGHRIIVILGNRFCRIPGLVRRGRTVVAFGD